MDYLIRAGVWGVTYGVAAYISQSLSVPHGLHIAANFIQAIFGMKDQVDSVWMLSVDTNGAHSAINIEVLGIA